MRKSQEYIDSVVKYLRMNRAINKRISEIVVPENADVSSCPPLIEVLLSNENWGEEYDFVVYPHPSFEPINAITLQGNPLQGRRNQDGTQDYKVEPQNYFYVALDEENRNITHIEKEHLFMGFVPIAHGGGSDFARSEPKISIDKLLLYETNSNFVEMIISHKPFAP